MKINLISTLSLIMLSFIFSNDSIGGVPCESAGNPHTTLYIYGGEDGDVYLGKLNGGEYDSESIWNEYGKYGSKYNSESIWNEYGKYGSEYSQYSPFNEYASHPPVLKDKNGKFYGYLTINQYKSKRADFDMIDIIMDNYDKIRDDRDDWYDVIF